MIKRILNSLKRNWILFLIFVLFTGTIITFEVITNFDRSQKTIAEISNQLTTLTDLKAMQLKTWRSERLIDGQTLQTDINFSYDISSLINTPSDYQSIKKCIDRFHSLLLNPNYSSIILVDQSGKELLHVGESEDKPRTNIVNDIHFVDLTHDVMLTHLYEASNNTVKMDMIVPVFINGDKTQPLLVYIVYLITPDAVLYPLIQSVPTSTETTETLLVHKEGQEVVFLNELRFKSDTALKMRIPLTEVEVPAVMAVNNKTGMVKGYDYRNVPVLASIAAVDGTDWKIIAKIDQEEVNKPIREQLYSSLITSLFLIIAGIISINVLWRRQSASFTKGLSLSEKQRKNLEEKYSTLFNQANDAILLVEESGKIIEANNQALKMYGYSKDELLTLSISNLRGEKEQLTIPKDMKQVKNGTANIFETTHKKKNGELFQVDVSSRYLLIDGKGFFQSLIRDITEKKQAEENLRRSELELKKAQAVSHVGSWRWNLVTDKITLSDELFNIFNLPKTSEGFSFDQFERNVIHPDDYERISKIRIEAMKSKRNFSFEAKTNRPDGIEKYIRVEAGELIFNTQGEIAEISGVAQDITEIKAAEREIRNSENLLQRIYDLLPVGLWLTDKNGRLIRSNKMVREIWGKDILVGIDEFTAFRGRRLPSHEEIQPQDWASVHTIRDGVTIRDEMIEIDAYDGKTKTILNYSTPILNDDGQLEGAIVLNLDITELKKAEEQLSAQLDELRRWNVATLGRENRIRDLKNEINSLLINQGLKPKYISVIEEDHE